MNKDNELFLTLILPQELFTTMERVSLKQTFKNFGILFPCLMVPNSSYILGSCILTMIICNVVDLRYSIFSLNQGQDTKCFSIGDK